MRAPDHPPDPGEPPHGDLRPDWDPHRPPFDLTRVDPGAATLWHDRGAPYGREPGGAAYDKDGYAERFHKSDPADPVAWPPNDGAVPGTKLDYSDAHQFVLDFGDRVDRLGPPTGKFMALMANKISADYEPRALHYASLYEPLHMYTLIPGTLIPGRLPKDWKIRVMETARAFGQPGGALGLIFLENKGNRVPVTNLTDPRIGVLRDDG